MRKRPHSPACAAQRTCYWHAANRSRGRLGLRWDHWGRSTRFGGHGGPEAPREGVHRAVAMDRGRPDELQRRQQSAEAAFRQLGIPPSPSMAVACSERIIRSTSCPHVPAARMEKLSEGGQRVEERSTLSQTSTARRITRRRHHPARTDPAQRAVPPQVAGIRPPHGVWASAGSTWSTPVPTNSTCWRTMPHALRRAAAENREAMIRHAGCSAISAWHPRRQLSDMLLETCARSPRSAKRAAGVRRAARGISTRPYYEHSFLADSMGVGWIRAADLVVDDDIIYGDDRRAGAGGRDLPPHRRRLPRSAGLPPGLAARVPRLFSPIARAMSRCSTLRRTAASPMTRRSAHARDRPLLFGRRGQAC